MYTRWSIYFFKMSLIVYYTVRITINSFFFVLFKLHSCFKLVKKKIHQICRRNTIQLNAILFISLLTHSSAIKSTFALVWTLRAEISFTTGGRTPCIYLFYLHILISDWLIKHGENRQLEKNKSVRNTKRCGVFKYLNTYKLFNDLTSK